MRKSDIMQDRDEHGDLYFGAMGGARFALPATLFIWALVFVALFWSGVLHAEQPYMKLPDSVIAVDMNKAGGVIVLMVEDETACRGTQNHRGYSTAPDQNVEYFCWMLVGNQVLASYDDGMQRAYVWSHFTVNSKIHDAVIRHGGTWQ